MTFNAFEAAAWDAWNRVPPEYKEGVDTLMIERDARRHPEDPDIYTLGECLTESWPASFDGPENIRSSVVLYYGSFLRISSEDPAFDWDREVWDTLTHELQHHLEGLASDDTLEDFDYAVDQNFKRANAESFDPFFFRAGKLLQPSVFEIDDDVFVELPAGGKGVVEFTFDGAVYRFDHHAQADVAFVLLHDGPSVRGDFYAVLVSPRSPFRLLRDALRKRSLHVIHTEAAAARAEE